jgi:hypothetical protein
MPHSTTHEAAAVRHVFTAEERALARAKAMAEAELVEDRIAFRFAPRWALGEDCRQWILFEQAASDRLEARSFYNDREPLLARMAEKPGVYDGVIAWLRGFLGPYHGCGRWFHDFAIFKPRSAAGLPAFAGLMRGLKKTPVEGPLAIPPLLAPGAIGAVLSWLMLREQQGEDGHDRRT